MMVGRLGRIFLDTNVILTGAFYDGPARELVRLGAEGFVYNAHVRRELRHLLRGSKRSPMVISMAEELVRRYLWKLNAVCIADERPPSTEGIKDPNDELVYGSALAYADVLCTYDWPHFPVGPLPVMSPDDVLSRSENILRIDHFIKPVKLESEGTLLLIITPHGSQSISLLRCAGGNVVACDRSGIFGVAGPGVKSQKISRPLWRRPYVRREYAMTVRYNRHVLEIAQWDKALDGSGWRKNVLTTATVQLVPPVSLLFATAEGGYAGLVGCIAGFPRYIGSDMRISKALDAESLDPVVNSGDLGDALDELEMAMRDHPETFNIILPGRT